MPLGRAVSAIKIIFRKLLFLTRNFSSLKVARLIGKNRLALPNPPRYGRPIKFSTESHCRKYRYRGESRVHIPKPWDLRILAHSFIKIHSTAWLLPPSELEGSLQPRSAWQPDKVKGYCASSFQVPSRERRRRGNGISQNTKEARGYRERVVSDSPGDGGRRHENDSSRR